MVGGSGELRSCSGGRGWNNLKGTALSPFLGFRKPWETIRPDAIYKRAKLVIRKKLKLEVITMPRR